MRVQLGKVDMNPITLEPRAMKNKALKYLLPCLKEYGEEFELKLNAVFKVAIGIGDVVTDNMGLSYEKNIFILTDSKLCRKFFLQFHSWIKDKPMYVDDYVFDDVQKSTFHMFILKFPEKYYAAIEPFKQGHYSKMYDKETIEKLFSNHPEIEKVLIKDHNYKFKFTKKLNRLFGTSINAEDYDGELDLPPKLELEIFNDHLKQ